MKTLFIDLPSFPFYTREQHHGTTVKNRCGRDFLYYALAYYFPDQYGPGVLTAYDLEHRGLLGISLPWYLAWTQLQFTKMPQYIATKGVRLTINGFPITSFLSFVSATLLSRMDVETALTEVEKSIDAGSAVGIDIAVGMGGLLDHVMFVYGYDADNLYIFETTETPIEYERLPGEFPHIMKLSKYEIRKRWTKFGRLWEVKME